MVFDGDVRGMCVGVGILQGSGVLWRKGRSISRKWRGNDLWTGIYFLRNLRFRSVVLPDP